MPPDVSIHRLAASEKEAVWAFAREQGLGGWSKGDFDRFAEQGQHSGLLALRGRRLAGFLLYAVNIEEVTLTLIALYVAPSLRRRGIGSGLLTELGRRLQAAGRARLETVVGERDLAAQFFLRANGFRAMRVLPAAFAGGADDGYWFERQLNPTPVSQTEGNDCKRQNPEARR